ncbi:hypothetical protein D3C81_498260 [compost metagenome]
MPHYIQTPEGMVRELLSSANPTAKPFTAENLIFGKPSVLLNNPSADTKVNVRGVDQVDYDGQVAIEYSRLDLGVLFNGTYRAEFEALGASNLHRLLPALNQALGTNFTPKDLQNIDLITLGQGDQVTLELRAKPGSVAYTGFTRVLFNRKIVILDDFVTVREFSELNHPDPIIEGSRSAGLLTWGQDFTLVRQHMRVIPWWANWRGQWYTHQAFADALAEFYGIEAWPQNPGGATETATLTDYATSQVAKANPEFQRVIVQTGIKSNGYSGTAYFHYNTI